MFTRNNLIILLVISSLYLVRLATFSQPHFVDGTKIKLTSVLKQEPKITGNQQSFLLSGIKIRTWRYPDYHYGDRLEIVGSIKNNSLEFPDIILLDKKGNYFNLRITKIKQRMELVIKRSLPEPQASLFAGIVLGTKSGMPKDFSNDLQKTGVMHMVVASGTNVAILASTTMSLLIFFLPRKKAALLSLVIIWFYVFLSGAEVPIVRAGIMGSLTFIALGLGREADAWRGLGISAFILLMINPLSFQDLGFQLSFAATFGILLFSPKIQKRLTRLPKQLQADLSQSLGAQLVTLTIILLNFGTFSIFSPLVNIILLPTIPYLMRLGLASSILGYIFFPLGKLGSWLAWPFLTYFSEVVKFFGKF